ncbi:hypothetical protein JCM11251_003685 [Rhodosporidiobolus azoricus]
MGILDLEKAISIAQYALGEGEHPQEGEKSSDFVNLLSSGLEQIKEHTLARDAKTVFEGLLQAGEAIDDRKLLLEKGVQMLSTLPPESPVGPLLTNFFIGRLWADLPKPPLTYVGDLKYRKADGSCNNPLFPTLGAAGQPYARSVPAVHAQPDHLPDPGLVFDALMKRDKFVDHPSGISSLLFNFATLITHTIFKTNPQDRNINDASSYLDLSPVYGDNLEQQMQVRTQVRGEIHPDAVASQRLFLMPPGTIALAIIFARNHNYIARRLLEVNQNNKYNKNWDALSDEQKRKQDEDLFQTARLVNCGAFQNVIFQDYIRIILHINETKSVWSLVPTGEIKQRVEGMLPRGTGQAVSAEFDLLYRWHSTISEKDAKWLEDIMKPHITKSYEEMTPADFFPIVEGILGDMDPRGPAYWTFGGNKRTGKDAAGAFRDEDIVRTLSEATDSIAGAFKARGSPAAMRVIDMMGIATARNEWNMATLNEFRKFLNLETYKTFEEWAGKGNEHIADTARRLYKHIDNLELMPGLACEEPKPSMAGSGLCPGYTISRAILSDAAALVRADRYLTTDYTAGNLTSAQFKDLQPDLDNGAFGGYLGKLLLRHFPEHYTFNSTYALFPFTTPHTTNSILRKLKINEQYDSSRPTAPMQWAIIRSYGGAKTVLDDEEAFENFYGAHIRAVQDKYSEPAFMSSFRAFSDPEKRARSQDLIDTAVFPAHWASYLLTSVGEATKQKLAENSWTGGTSVKGVQQLRLDVVTDLVVPVAMDRIAKMFGLPMKTKEHPYGLFTHQDLYEMLSDCYTFVYQNIDPTVGYKLRESAKKHADILRSVILFRLGAIQGRAPALHKVVESVFEAFTGKHLKSAGFILSKDARQTYERVLIVTNRSHDEVAGVLLTAMVSMVVAVPVTVNTIDVLLKPEYKKDLDNLCKMTQENVGVGNDSMIARMVEECSRLQPAIAGCARRSKITTALTDGDRKPSVQKDQLVFVSMKTANRDDKVFPKPNAIDLNRNLELYKLNDSVQGLTNQKGESFSTTFALSMLRELCQHSSLARAPGKAGHLGRIDGVMGINTYLREDQAPAAFPCSMEITFSPVKHNA